MASNRFHGGRTVVLRRKAVSQKQLQKERRPTTVLSRQISRHKWWSLIRSMKHLSALRNWMLSDPWSCRAYYRQDFKLTHSQQTDLGVFARKLRTAPVSERPAAAGGDPAPGRPVWLRLSRDGPEPRRGGRRTTQVDVAPDPFLVACRCEERTTGFPRLLPPVLMEKRRG